MRRDPISVPEDLVQGIRALTDGADEAGIRVALASLTPPEEKHLRRLLASPPPGRFGPLAWADLARGTDPQVAAARELSGYYTLLAERDTLATLLKNRGPARPPNPKTKALKPGPGREPEREPETETGPEPGSRGHTRAAAKDRADRIQHLLGLFAYHRDAPLVARSLHLPLEDLNRELDALRIRRKAYRLARGSDTQMPLASPVPSPRGPPVRRRTRTAPAPAAPPEPARAPTDQDTLRAALAEAGPRRALLAARLGVGGRALLARFRAAGLERELALRERDLIRALYSRHRGAEGKVAEELRITPEELRDLVAERGLSRDLASLRQGFRREALRLRWPKDRIEQVLNRREELQELGVLEGLEREVSVRASVIWNSLQGKQDALDLFARKLRLTREDAIRLQKLLHLS
jgi:hypothetical protein